MIYYEAEIKKSITKGVIPKDVFKRFRNAFIALDATGDLGLFDIKKLKSSEKRNYYRLRKGKYRAIFYIEKNNYFVISIAKREEVYLKWV
jgi:mRNA interferase RelE/StbE